MFTVVFAGVVDRWRLDLSCGVRNLRRAPAFAVAAVLSLGLGIGANTAIFSIVDAALLKPLPVAEPHRLVQVGLTDTAFTNPIWESFRERQQVLDAPFAWATERLDLSAGGEKRLVEGLIASGGFFSALGVPASLGRTFTIADDRRGGGPDGPVAVIGHAFWRDRYGASPTAIGSTLTLNGRAFTIVGVTPPRFFGLDVGRRFDVAVPLGTEPLLHGGKDSRLDRRTMWWLQIMGRLKTGQTLAQAEAGVRTAMTSVREATRPPEQTPGDASWYLREPVTLRSAAAGVSYVRERYEAALTILMGVVALVLLIACANLANLLLARATARQREFAVRLALGASRARLMRQVLVECLLIALAGAALGLLFARWVAPVLLHQLSSRNTQVFLDVPLDWRLLGFTTLVAIATTVSFGLAPAFRSTRLSANDLLKSQTRAIAVGGRGASIEKAIVVVQIATSLVLVVSAVWFVRSFTSLARLDPGFAREHVLLVQADTVRADLSPDRRRLLYWRLLDAMAALPGVQKAAYMDVTPISGNASQLDIVVYAPAESQAAERLASGSQGDGRQAGARRGAADRGAGAPVAGAAVTGAPVAGASLAGSPVEAAPGAGTPPAPVSSHANRVSPEYFETLGTPLRAGRMFDARDTLAGPPVAIVNEAFVRRFLRGASPLGGRILNTRQAASEPGIEIIGVVADSKYRSLRETPPPTAYFPMTQDAQPFSRANFALRVSGDTGPVRQSVVAAVRDVHRDVSVELTTLARQVNDSLIRDRVLALLSGFFGVLALLVAGLGLYGVMSLAVARRRQEIGVRMALGAPPASVVRLVLRDVTVMTLAGFATGAMVAWLSGRLVRALLFNLEPTDPGSWLLALTTLGAAAALAGYLPARRAARVDPMAALRED